MLLRSCYLQQQQPSCQGLLGAKRFGNNFGSIVTYAHGHKDAIYSAGDVRSLQCQYFVAFRFLCNMRICFLFF